MNKNFMMDSSILKQMTDPFIIERNGKTVCEANGFFCGRDYPSTIQLVENADIQDGDWLIHSVTNRRYYAQKTEPITMDGEVIDWMVKYQSEGEHNATTNTSSANIHIHSVNGPAIIGSQQNATLNIGNSVEDMQKLLPTMSPIEQQELTELISELQKVENSAHPILIEGTLSKFSDLLKKHSDLLVAVGGWAVQLLIGK